MKSKHMLSNAEIASFSEQVALLFHAGITPTESMRILLEDTDDHFGKDVIQSILDVCEQGESFYKAMSTAEVFPNYVLHMVSLGEASGNLDDVMQSLADYYEHENQINESLRSAISYPLVMILMMLLVIIVLITKVLPIFNQVFVQLGNEMTGLAANMMQLGNILKQYSIGFAAFLVILLITFFYCTKTMHGKELAHRALAHFGPMKSFYRNVAAGRFASGMALALSSGMDTYESLDLVAELVNYQEVHDKIMSCKKSIEDGDNFTESLLKCGIFNNLYSRMVAVGFKSGSMDKVMSRIAAGYDKETDQRIHSIISVLEPTLVIVLSLIVGLILLSVILPLMGIMSSIG
ncbi:MAG: type II secretion system F family protein [Lachnospiraceae bacterium]|nr:type II secretion system F family protein [Lachnospiraceae bacterium]